MRPRLAGRIARWVLTALTIAVPGAAFAPGLIMMSPTRVAVPETATDAVRAIMPTDQTALADQLDLLPARDLMALIDGLDPTRLGLQESGSLRGNDWRTLIVSYSRAALIDRQQAADRWWDVLSWSVAAIVTALATVLAFVLGKRQERNKQAPERRRFGTRHLMK